MLTALAAPGPAAARDLAVRSFDGVSIVAHFLPAAGLQPGERRPTVIEGTSFAARGVTDPGDNSTDRIGIATMRDAGFNVLTWDSRGFGGSGGVAQFDSPDFEARDVQALIDYIATAPEALLDGPGDPRVGMVGSSYGGGIQYVTAALDHRVDAIAPDLTWHSLVTSYARDGAFKAGWLLDVCTGGEIFGLADGVVDGLTGPAGAQLGSTAPQLNALCLEGNLLGSLSAASQQWLADRGPGSLLDQIRTPTLITQGTVDTLFPLREAIANYRQLRASDVPVKMLWYCGGHGTCDNPAATTDVLRRTGLAWLRRWLNHDSAINTGPRFEWVDDSGAWHAAPDYPLDPAGALGAAGGGSLTLAPLPSLTLGPIVLGAPPLSVVEIPFDPPAVARDVVGEPTVTLTYRGSALPVSTFVYAQVFDAATKRVVGAQVTPIPVVLDGREHTITRRLDAIALRARPDSRLRLQLVPSTRVYGMQRSVGSVRLGPISSTLPLVRTPSRRAASRLPTRPYPTPHRAFGRAR